MVNQNATHRGRRLNEKASRIFHWLSVRLPTQIEPQLMHQCRRLNGKLLLSTVPSDKPPGNRFQLLISVLELLRGQRSPCVCVRNVGGQFVGDRGSSGEDAQILLPSFFCQSHEG